MLIGADLNESKKLVAIVKKKHLILKLGGIVLFGCVYFATKLLFSHYESISAFQFINQITILLFVSFLFVVILGGEERIQTFKKSVILLISGIAALTLEIYVFHYYFISLFEKRVFPLNLVLIVICTLVVAYIVHKVLEKLTGYMKQKGL